MLASVVLGFACFATILASPGKLPDSIPRCKRSDPKIDECLKKSIQDSIPIIKDGFPKLGVLPLDPLKITALDIGQGSGPVSIDLKFKDLSVQNLKTIVIKDVMSDLKNYKLKIIADVKEPLVLDAMYNMKGNVLILPLVGEGKCHLVLDNIQAILDLSGVEHKKGDATYMKLENFNLDFNITKLQMNFENLLSQNKNLGDNLNLFLNENWQEIWKELYPAIKEAFNVAMKEIAVRIFSKVPSDEIFLP